MSNKLLWIALQIIFILFDLNKTQLSSYYLDMLESFLWFFLFIFIIFGSIWMRYLLLWNTFNWLLFNFCNIITIQEGCWLLRYHVLKIINSFIWSNTTLTRAPAPLLCTNLDLRLQRYSQKLMVFFHVFDLFIQFILTLLNIHEQSQHHTHLLRVRHASYLLSILSFWDGWLIIILLWFLLLLDLLSYDLIICVLSNLIF